VIKAVLFDLDETLIHDEAVSRHAFFICALSVTRDQQKARQLAEAAEAHAKRCWAALPAIGLEYATRIGHSALEGLWATYDSSIPGEAALQSKIEAYRLEAWRAALEQCELESDPEALQILWRHLRARYPLYPDADELLVQLRSKYKLGIVTNGVAGLQRRKLEGSGLLHWFDAVAISGEVGIGKPERGIFEWVAAELNVPLEACVMVGDNAERDVQGGINAGMRTVWLERRFKPRGAPATLEVNELLELLPWLEGLKN
jgi:HAD superfamily hydrolase (TIGR01549 family)